MRMWMIRPGLLCNRHLLGEHGEIHKHRHIFEMQYSIKGRIDPVVQIEPASMKQRHDDLANEITARGMKHKSDYTQPDLTYLGIDGNVKVDIQQSLFDLYKRCNKCKNKQS